MSAMGPAEKISRFIRDPNSLKILKTCCFNFAKHKKITLVSNHNAPLAEHSDFPLSEDGQDLKVEEEDIV